MAVGPRQPRSHRRREQRGVMEPTDIKVGDTTYRLRRWSYKEGKKWLFKLITLIADAGSATGDSGVAMRMVAEKLGDKTFEELCEVVEKYTDVVHPDGRVVLLSGIAADHMRGRFLDLAVILRGHLVQEYESFFANLGDLLPSESG